MEVSNKAVADDLLGAINQQLEVVLPSVRKAVEQRSRIVLLSLWERIDYLALLPFHLHLFVRPRPVAFRVPPQPGEGKTEARRRLGRGE